MTSVRHNQDLFYASKVSIYTTGSHFQRLDSVIKIKIYEFYRLCDKAIPMYYQRAALK